MNNYKNKIIGMGVILPLFLIVLLTPRRGNGQFAPPAGQPGSTAISADSNIIVSWANHCSLERGLMDISNDTLGFADFGTSTDAIGPVNDAVVSLGDKGSAVLEFIPPIINGPGFDFAVFENSFSDNFLELAFVEVSNDGINWTRFPAISNTQTNNQVETFGTLDATKIYNLAGKYRAGFGTPFDLEELKAISPDLDLNNIAFVKIIDVIGSIDEKYASHDSQDHIINDPWPTPFGSSGFDLEAVGAIYNLDYLGSIENHISKVELFPNPAKNFISINADGEYEISFYELNGKLINKYYTREGENINISSLPSGLIIAKISAGGETKTLKLIHLN